MATDQPDGGKFSIAIASSHMCLDMCHGGKTQLAGLDGILHIVFEQQLCQDSLPWLAVASDQSAQREPHLKSRLAESRTGGRRGYQTKPEQQEKGSPEEMRLPPIRAMSVQRGNETISQSSAS